MAQLWRVGKAPDVVYYQMGRPHVVQMKMKPPLRDFLRHPSADSTVFVTRTITNTVTSFTGVPITGIAIVTRTELLTFINPVQQTQTSTVTVTSFFKRAKRTFGDSPLVTPTSSLVIPSSQDAARPIITQSRRPGSEITVQSQAVSPRKVEKREDLTLTTTVMVTTTVFVDNAVRATITHVVYSTTVLAPNAIATVFVTTTVRRPSNASTSTTIPVITSTGSTSRVSPTTDTSELTISATSETASSEVATTSSITEATSSTSTLILSSSSSTTTLIPPFTTTSSSTELTTSETMDPMLTPTSSPTPTLVQPPPSTSRSLSAGQIIGLVLGILFGIILLILAAFLFRRLVVRRRRIQAEMRQKLAPTPHPPPPSGGPAPAPIVPTGPSSGGSSSAGYSGLTGEGEVRIVIRPAPKRRTQSSGVQPASQGFVWPMPPGYDGRVSGFPIFIEEGTTTGSDEERERERRRGTEEREWSIVSERGSPSPTIGLGLGREDSRDESNRPVTQGSGWDTSVGRRSERSGATGESFPGLGTLLTPPPVHNRYNNGDEGRLFRARDDESDEERILPLRGRSSSSESEREQRQAGVGRRVVRETMGGPSSGVGGGGGGGGVRGGEGSGQYPMGSLGIGRAW
ncbi:hypothetical protein QBC43DRAFT_353128 [Cladorrhinum sp. PSN259]|nr:hypothetical protein QBC43DRAFT_353128 [Cladorrhinum sp. PSN259]